MLSWANEAIAHSKTCFVDAAMTCVVKSMLNNVNTVELFDQPQNQMSSLMLYCFRYFYYNNLNQRDSECGFNQMY